MSANLTPKQAAVRIGIAAQTLAKMRMAGDGPPFVKIGRRVVYELKDVEDWLEGRALMPGPLRRRTLRPSPMLITLLRLGAWGLHSGLHHLPADLRMDGAAGEALEALLVFDRLVAAEARLDVLNSQAVDIGRAWVVLSSAGLDPLRVYARATVAKVGPEPERGEPVATAGGLVRLPIAPRFLAEAEERARAVERIRRYLMGFASHLIDRAVYQVSPTVKQAEAVRRAKNTLHAAIVFFGASYEAAREADVLVTVHDALSDLADVGLGSNELEAMVMSPAEGSRSSKRRR